MSDAQWRFIQARASHYGPLCQPAHRALHPSPTSRAAAGKFGGNRLSAATRPPPGPANPARPFTQPLYSRSPSAPRPVLADLAPGTSEPGRLPGRLCRVGAGLDAGGTPLRRVTAISEREGGCALARCFRLAPRRPESRGAFGPPRRRGGPKAAAARIDGVGGGKARGGRASGSRARPATSSRTKARGPGFAVRPGEMAAARPACLPVPGRRTAARRTAARSRCPVQRLRL